MTASAESAERTPLEDRLISLIRANGPITVADYMSDALGHPHDGYYMARAPIGAEGDFTTAPEISQIFGELIGLWLLQTWTDMGAPGEFNLVELGPGRGVLMADVLRAAALRREFLDAAHLVLVETSGRLRHEQQTRLRGQSVKPTWADEFGEIPPGPLLIVANEFFDCLPIRQFERTANGWRERMVGLNDAGDSLAFTHHPTPPPPEIDLPPPGDTEVGAIIEICEPATELARAIAARLVEHGGHALIIDYGHYGAGAGDSLQAVRAHAYWPVLSAPGAADMTAHVNFEAIAKAAIEGGASAWPPLAQGAFLHRLGLAARLERLCAGKSAEAREALITGAHRISAPDEMGEVFKAMCISAPSLPPPPGFETP